MRPAVAVSYDKHSLSWTSALKAQKASLLLWAWFSYCNTTYTPWHLFYNSKYSLPHDYTPMSLCLFHHIPLPISHDPLLTVTLSAIRLPTTNLPSATQPWTLPALLRTNLKKVDGFLKGSESVSTKNSRIHKKCSLGDYPVISVSKFFLHICLLLWKSEIL